MARIGHFFERCKMTRIGEAAALVALVKSGS